MDIYFYVLCLSCWGLCDGLSLNFPGLADFPMVFIFSMHQNEGSQRMIEEPSNWWVSDPHLIVEMCCSHIKRCIGSCNATIGQSQSVIPLCLHKWWELCHVTSFAREKRIGLADISRMGLKRNTVVNGVQSAMRRYLSFPMTTFFGLSKFHLSIYQETYN
jgi:hypothetical protein